MSQKPTIVLVAFAGLVAGCTLNAGDQLAGPDARARVDGGTPDTTDASAAPVDAGAPDPVVDASVPSPADASVPTPVDASVPHPADASVPSPVDASVPGPADGGPQQVHITIAPTTAVLPPGGTIAFTATVTGTSNRAVTWSATGGTVSPAGFYTAPSGSGSYVVTATSAADTNQKATANVTLTPAGDYATGVTVHLEQVFPNSTAIRFGVPVPEGAVASVNTVSVQRAGAPVSASIKSLLARHDATGAAVGVRALLIQVPTSVLGGATSADVFVSWQGGSAPGSTFTPFSDSGVSATSPEVVHTAQRTITSSGGVNRLVETVQNDETLFSGREPRVIALFPLDYLAKSGILGKQITSAEAAVPGRAGLKFLSDQMTNFALGAMYALPYAVNPDAVVDPVDAYEAWLYDRCATFLTAYSHTGDVRFLRHALRSCSYYSDGIDLSTGIWTGKSDPDSKYSHLRGLYAYYALTGDERALASGTAIADLWYDDQTFVGPYRQGHLRGEDKLWTERLLGTSMEGLYYGFRLTGDAKYLTALKEMIETAYRHLTGNAAQLATINPWNDFPPQNCFIHNAAQHSEGVTSEPWCSGWMSELLIDALLQYQEMTGESRVDEIFVRLARFLRDVGSAYFSGDLRDDTFLHPSICFDPASADPRILVPLYGAGLRANGSRASFGDWADFEHCTDATAMSAAAIRGLKRLGQFDANPVGPFASEGASFVQMHSEFAYCSKWTFGYQTRSQRDPAAWTSAELAAGLSNPAQFIADNKIGFPIYNISPLRKLSWWFNQSMLQYGMLSDAGVDFPALTPGAVKPSGCP